MLCQVGDSHRVCVSVGFGVNWSPAGVSVPGWLSWPRAFVPGCAWEQTPKSGPLMALGAHQGTLSLQG